MALSQNNQVTKNKIIQFLQFAAVGITVLSVGYFVLWCFYTLITVFIIFTGLGWLIKAILGASIGYTVVMAFQEHRAEKDGS